MIVVITCWDDTRYDHNGKKIGKLPAPIEVVSHGVHAYSLKTIPLEVAPLEYYRKNNTCRWDKNYGWVLNEN